MYAIIKKGSKQYRVKKDDIIDVELLKQDLGSEVTFDVLFVGDGTNFHVGSPTVSGSIVKGELLEVVAGEKIEAMKYKQRKSEYRRFGHRQHYSRVKITEIDTHVSKSHVKKTSGERHHGA